MKSSPIGRAAIGVVLAAAVAVLGLAGCGRLDRASGIGAGEGVETTNLSWDAQALEAVGVSPAELVPPAEVADEPTPSATAAPDGPRRKHRVLRYGFAKNVLHGEAVVTTDEGSKTVVVQRGKVTAIDATSMTVRSTDGFMMTWTLGSPLTVLERRTQIQPSAIAVGTEVGVAGAKSADTTTARLVVVPRQAG